MVRGSGTPTQVAAPGGLLFYPYPYPSPGARLLVARAALLPQAEGGMGAGYMGVTSTLTSASVAALSLGSSLTLCTFDLRLVSMCLLEAPVPFILCFFFSSALSCLSASLSISFLRISGSRFLAACSG